MVRGRGPVENGREAVFFHWFLYIFVAAHGGGGGALVYPSIIPLSPSPLKFSRFLDVRRCPSRRRDPPAFLPPKAVCGREYIGIELDSPFSGRIFASHREDLPHCSKLFHAAPAARLTLMLNDTECGVHRNTTDPVTVPSDVYTVRLVVSFSFSALTEDDRIFQLRCVHHRGGGRKDVRSMQAFYDAQDVVRHQLLTSSDAPKCHYSLHLNTLDGGAVNNAKVGDMIFHRWECGKSGDFRFRVYRCFVHNGHRQSFMLVDDNGCSLDETILPHPKYDETNGVIYAPAKAFRFSRTKRVHFNCLLQVCARADAECAKSIPPHCPRSQQKRDLPKNLTIEERLMRIGQPIDGKLAAMDATRGFDGFSSEIQPKKEKDRSSCLSTSGPWIMALAITNCFSLTVAVVAWLRIQRNRRAINIIQPLPERGLKRTPFY